MKNTFLEQKYNIDEDSVKILFLNHISPIYIPKLAEKISSTSSPSLILHSTCVKCTIAHLSMLMATRWKMEDVEQTTSMAR